jgi:cadmium resistance protein CadD (predicted permease)
LIAIGGGSEELAVCIPFLGSLAMADLLVALVTLVLLVPVWRRVIRAGCLHWPRLHLLTLVMVF